MEPKRSKYDTNPLDEDVADRAEEAFESPSTERTFGGRTSEMASTANDTFQAYSESEAPTRHIGDKVTAYPSVFVPPKPRERVTYEPPRVAPANVYQPPPGPPPAVYQPPPLPILEKPGSRKVSGLGIQERWAVLLPYLPFWLAIVASIVELLLVPRTESRVRYHAAQGLTLQVVITAISTMLTLAGLVSGRFTGGSIFHTASIVLLIVAMVRVWKGKPFAITILDEPRKWLEEKIRPRN